MARLVTADGLWRPLVDGTWLHLAGDIWLHLAGGIWLHLAAASGCCICLLHLAAAAAVASGCIWLLHLAAAAAATGELKGLWESHLTLRDILHLSK